MAKIHDTALVKYNCEVAANAIDCLIESAINPKFQEYSREQRVEFLRNGLFNLLHSFAENLRD